MNISLVEDEKAYQNLADKYGSVFSKVKWLDLFEGALELYGIYDNGNHLIGGFHLYRYKKFGFNFICNAPFTPHIGLFFVNPTTNKSSSSTFNKDIIQQLASFFARQKCMSFDVALPHSIIDTQPLQWNKFQVKPKYTYLIDLAQSKEEIWDHFSSQRRKSIRKAISDNIEVKEVTDFSMVKALIEKTFSRQEKKLNTAVIDKILFKFADHSNAFAFMANTNGQPSAVTFCLYDKDTAYYLLGGYDDKYKHHGVGALTMWESIQYAKKIGLKNFDFEGSMLPNVEEYFREFGGRLTSYYMITKKVWPLQVLKN